MGLGERIELSSFGRWLGCLVVFSVLHIIPSLVCPCFLGVACKSMEKYNASCSARYRGSGHGNLLQRRLVGFCEDCQPSWRDGILTNPMRFIHDSQILWLVCLEMFARLAEIRTRGAGLAGFAHHPPALSRSDFASRLPRYPKSHQQQWDNAAEGIGMQWSRTDLQLDGSRQRRG
jgi:hypothetical protein